MRTATHAGRAQMIGQLVDRVVERGGRVFELGLEPDGIVAEKRRADDGTGPTEVRDYFIPRDGAAGEAVEKDEGSR